MEYQFYKDGLLNVAECSFEQELIGVFITEELQNIEQVQQLQNFLQQSSAASTSWQAQHYSLIMNEGEIEVHHNSESESWHEGYDEEGGIPDESLGAQQQIAGCGLEDFVELIEQWSDFISI